MATITFNAPTFASDTFGGKVLHERMVKLAQGVAYEIVGTRQHTTAHSDMAESVRHHEGFFIKSRKNGVLWVSPNDACGNPRPAGEVVMA